MKALISKYGIGVTLIMIILEYACFPLPSEILLPLTGYVASFKNFNLLLLIFLSSIAGLIGCLVCYLLGYLLGEGIIKKISKNTSIKTKIEKTKKLYFRNKKLYLSVGRLVPICRTYISFFSGIYKDRIIEFVMFSIIGIFVWNSILISVGYYCYNYIDMQIIYKNYKTIIVISIFIIIVVNVIKKKKQTI